MAITNKDDFKDYCLRALGAPVINIDITDEQMDDRVDEALTKMQDFSFNATERMYLKHLVTSTDVTNQYIEIPEYVTGVIKVLPFSSGTGSTQSPFSIQYQLRLNDMFDLGSTSMIYYEQVQNHMSMLDQLLNGVPIFRYTRTQNKLSIDTHWGEKIKAGQYIIVECYRALDPDDFNQIWDDAFFKRYAIATFRRQWGANLRKFNNVQMIGGAILNGEAIYQEAIEELTRLDQELRDVYEEPPTWFMG